MEVKAKDRYTMATLKYISENVSEKIPPYKGINLYNAFKIIGRVKA